MGSGDIVPRILNLDSRMEVRCQLCVPSNLPRHPQDRRQGGLLNWSESGGHEKNMFPADSNSYSSGVHHVASITILTVLFRPCILYTRR